MEVDKVADMVADMVVDKVADMVADVVADMKRDKVADIVADLEMNKFVMLQFGERVGHGDWLIWTKLFDPKLTRLVCLLSFVSLFSCQRQTHSEETLPGILASFLHPISTFGSVSQFYLGQKPLTGKTST